MGQFGGSPLGSVFAHWRSTPQSPPGQHFAPSFEHASLSFSVVHASMPVGGIAPPPPPAPIPQTGSPHVVYHCSESPAPPAPPVPAPLVPVALVPVALVPVALVPVALVPVALPPLLPPSPSELQLATAIGMSKPTTEMAQNRCVCIDYAPSFAPFGARIV
jgi:hypothetical protein